MILKPVLEHQKLVKKHNKCYHYVEIHYVNVNNIYTIITYIRLHVWNVDIFYGNENLKWSMLDCH